ncbi:MAG: hypothetical protein KTR31_02385 [Myxococcales bacterium]|nr:hypothetical protein [Myxococcales bacterium]
MVRGAPWLLLVGCGGSADVGSVRIDPVGSEPFTTDSPSVTCGSADLCERSRIDCGVDLTQADCEGWYADAGNCTSMERYEVCNCDCLSQDSCDAYFTCGEICFGEHCS